MSKLTMIVAAGAGYVLGARAGRERYEQIRSQAQRVWSDPRVQQRKDQATETAKQKAGVAADAAKQKATQAAGAAQDKASSVTNTAKEKVADTADEAGNDAIDDPTWAARQAAGAEPTNNEGPDARQPAPPQGI